jgi:hypothetical protein
MSTRDADSKRRAIVLRIILHNSVNEMTKITNSNQSHKSYIGNTNQRMGVHGPMNISEVGSGAMEE